MADAIRVSGAVSGTDKSLSFETGKLAQQSMGAVLATMGGTTVLATANAAKDVKPGMDFFPLTIDVEERAYAAGKIPGSFFRREGRPTEDAILTCRLTDRPLRPAFPDGFRNETQVVLTILGHIAHLKTQPHIGRPGRVPGTRELLARPAPCIVPYRVRGEAIEILRVLHTAQAWPDNF